LGVQIADELLPSRSKSIVGVRTNSGFDSTYLRTCRIETNDEMKQTFQKIIDEEKPQVGIFSAAVLDFDIESPATGKISSKESLSFKLKPSEKLIQSIRSSPLIRVGFKLESRIELPELKERIRKWAEQSNTEIVIGNRLRIFDPKMNTGPFFYSRKSEILWRPRQSVKLLKNFGSF